MSSKLDLLKQVTTVVADTGDFETGKAYGVQDATTNPSLILAAAKIPKYAPLIEDAVKYGVANKDKGCPLVLAMNKCLVNFGCEWLKFIPGVVSTEIDARLSFDKEATIQRGREIIALYKEAGIAKERVLLKIAATWEGIEAAKVLEAEGFHTNITLLFNKIQAIAAAQNAKATLISPFVGRILDWYKAAEKRDSYPPADDPGVKSVKQIYGYFKKFGLKTIVMGASFRNMEEIEELAGCDNLTISPALLEQLKKSTGDLPRKLSPTDDFGDIQHIDVDEKTFRWLLNEDPMATEKLAEGIRKFGADIVTLENDLKARIVAAGA